MRPFTTVLQALDYLLYFASWEILKRDRIYLFVFVFIQMGNYQITNTS